MSKICLIVGGPLDGQWREISDYADHVSLVVLPKKSIFDFDPREPVSEGPVAIEKAKYQREKLRTKEKTYEFFRYIDLSVEDAFDLLFQGYRQ